MSGTGLELGLVALLTLLNALFSGSELALLSLRESQVARLGQRGRAGRALVRLISEPNRFLATVQVGITLAGFLASATAAVSLAEPLEEPLGVLGGAARPASIVVVTIVLTFFTLVVGELAPKRIAMQRSERWAVLVARPLLLLSLVFRPVVALLGVSTDLLVRLFGVDPSRSRESVSEEEIREIVASAPTITDDQRQILEGAFELKDRSLRHVLRPRRDVISVRSDATVPEALAVLLAAGHSRAPVIVNDLDDASGIVHLRDLVGASTRAGALARPALALPETLGLLEALQRMRTDRQRLALVIDEYGGVEGIVSLEDILEEIVGEIYDETDRDLLAVVRLPDGAFELPGGFPVHDLTDLGIMLEGDAATTIGGLVTHALGRLPRAGDEVELEGWTVRVLTIDRRAVGSLQLVPAVTDHADWAPGRD
ncbi:MAG: HlyC/CorC family transporter [Actinobacteria bacterium]|nr:HlyC/CorC family transporter [Actinomycetota bacterium]